MTWGEFREAMRYQGVKDSDHIGALRMELLPDGQDDEYVKIDRSARSYPASGEKDSATIDITLRHE